MKSHLKKILLIPCLMILCLLTSQCGFKLRAKNPLPPQLYPLYLQTSQPYDKLVLLTKQRLTSLGVRLTDSSLGADAILKILSIDFSHSSPDITTSDKSRIYTLTYQLVFELQDAKGKTLLPAQSILISRKLILNQGQTLYSNNELSLIKQEMQREIVTLLLYRLEAKAARDALR